MHPRRRGAARRPGDGRCRQAEHLRKGKPETERTAPKGKAYGKRCQRFSKRKVAGEKGTPFSRCVKALKQADRDSEAVEPAAAPAS